MQERIREAYVGEYAGGKSENAVNRSLDLTEQGRRVRLVDLDLVEPFYTLRPLREILIKKGINVIALKPEEAFGLGEAAVPLRQESIDSLDFDGDVIIDVGYGFDGMAALKLVKGALIPKALDIIMVVNALRPLTSTVSVIVNYVKSFGRVDQLLNNTHLGAETTVEIVQAGARLIDQAAKILGLPVVATSAIAKIAAKIGPVDAIGNPVRPLRRFMDKAF